jgi:peptide/nickel transport system substrate-binding protein
VIGTVALALVVACTSPSVNPARERASAGTGTDGAAGGAARTLRLAIHEPIEALYGESGNVQRELGDVFNSSLTYLDSTSTLHPRLAQKIPSIADGDWQVSQDGSMEVTWKLKPSLKWHDGWPFTAADLAFTVRMFKDPASPFSMPRAVRLVDEALAPDAETLVLRYRRVFNGAAVANTPDFPPVPRHLIEGFYAQSGGEGLANSPIWTTSWVGMGPYRVTSHVLGNQIDGESFGGYVFGRPLIERVSVRIIPDVNTIVANLLAGEIDLVPTGALEAAHGADLRRQWEASGRGSMAVMQNRLRQMQLQFRDPALPWAGDLRVRQAALHLIDRQAIVDGIIHGMTTVGDVAMLPTNPVYPLLERRGIPKYGYDRAQAERLLDSAGRPRGADGLRRNASGAVFAWNPAVSGEPDLPEVLVIVDGFKAGGIQSEPDLIPDSLPSNDRNERRGRAHSITRSAALDYSYWERFSRSEISSQQNRWRGSNTGGYTNPAFESLFERWSVALDPTVRHDAEADLHKLLVDELAYLPLFYNIDLYAHRKGIIGPKPNYSEGRNITIDVHTWKIES